MNAADLFYSQKPEEPLIGSLRLEKFPSRGQNILLRVVSDLGSEWILKFCRSSDDIAHEVCKREELTSLFGSLLDVPVGNAWVIPSSIISTDLIQQETYTDLIRDEFVIMPLYEGQTISDSKETAKIVARKCVSDVANMFGFMHWLGDEDRGLDDIMFKKDEYECEIILIDNGLCGRAIA